MRETWTFHSAGQLVFGRNAVRQLGEIVGRLGMHRALVVTDPVLLKTGLLEPVRACLTENSVSVEVFSGGEPEPSLEAGEACIAVARQCQADVLVALGGGSNMDLAKIAATVLAHGGKPSDYIGDDQIPGPVSP